MANLFEADFREELGDVSVELERIGTLADGVFVLRHPRHGDALDGRAVVR